MNREKLIREMIQIELLYQTRQRILKEGATGGVRFQTSSTTNKTLTPQDKSQGLKKLINNTGTYKFTNKDELKQSYLLLDANNQYSLDNSFENELKAFFKAKNLHNDQITSIIDEIKKIIVDPGKHDKFTESLFNFPFNALPNNASASDIAGKLNLMVTDGYLNTTVHSFHNVLYLNVTKPSGTMGPGKGEFLVLSIIQGATSGGGKQHDIILANGTEIEIKQGNTAADTCLFNTNVKRNTKTSKARADFLLDYNNFLEKFVKSTQKMNQLLNLTDQYYNSYIQSNFLEIETDPASSVSGKKVAKSTTIKTFNELLGSEIYDPDANPGIVNVQVSYILDAINRKINSNVSSIQKKVQSSTNNKSASHIEINSLLSDILHVNDQEFNKLDNFELYFDLDPPGSKRKKNIPNIHVFEKTQDAKAIQALLNSKPYLQATSMSLTDFFNAIAKDIDKTSPFIDTSIKNSMSLGQLNTFVDSVLNVIIEKYDASLQYYSDFLKDITQLFTSKPQAQISNSIKNIKNDLQMHVDKVKNLNLKKDEKIAKIDNIFNNYYIFSELHKGLKQHEKGEMSVEFKYYDENGNLKNKKNVINTIDKEFQIITPKNMDIRHFFNSKADQKMVLSIRDENMSEEEFKNIIDTKEMFKFLRNNINLNTQSTQNNKKTNNTSSTLQPIQKDENILTLIDKMIDSLNNLQQEIYDEYTAAINNQNQNQGALIYISEAKSGVLNFSLAFNPSNKLDFKKFKDMSALDSYITNLTPTTPATPATPALDYLPLINTINPSEKIVWAGLNQQKKADNQQRGLLEGLLALKVDITKKLNDISQKVNQIIGLDKQIMDLIKNYLSSRKLSKYQQNAINNAKYIEDYLKLI